MSKLMHRSKLFLHRNASTILTCIGGIGVIATSALAVKATPKALRTLEDAKEKKGEELTKFEVVRTAGPAYIPAVITGAATIACIFGANTLNKRQQAALASAYAVLDSSYKEYKDKIKELYGEDADGRVKEKIAKDKYEDLDIQVEDDKQLFFDVLSGRYFESTMKDVISAQYYVNRTMALRDYVYLNEYYDHLGLEPVDYGYELGWSTGACLACYWQEWVDFVNQKTVLEDGLECYLVNMLHEPIMNFADFM